MATAMLEHGEGAIVYNADLEATAQKDVRNGETTLYGVQVDAGGADDLFVKAYDNADPTVGTTEPELILYVEGTGGTNGGHAVFDFGPEGIDFATGLSLAAVDNAGATDGPGRTGTTNPLASAKAAFHVS